MLTQTEELLLKRQKLLEKKIAQETERAKEFTRASNKRGERSSGRFAQSLVNVSCVWILCQRSVANQPLVQSFRALFFRNVLMGALK